MIRKLRLLSVISLLAGWVVIQAAAVHHESSAEHLFSGANHHCLAQVVQLDDLLVANDEICLDSKGFRTTSVELPPHQGSPVILGYSFHARAPPKNDLTHSV